MTSPVLLESHCIEIVLMGDDLENSSVEEGEREQAPTCDAPHRRWHRFDLPRAHTTRQRCHHRAVLLSREAGLYQGGNETGDLNKS